jgi:molecular chaperone HscB
MQETESEAATADVNRPTLNPLPPDTDYYQVLGLPRRLRLDPTGLENAYHERSRQFHPDLFRLAAPRQRMIALENSALVNRAYRTLRDPFERAAYLLKLESGDEEPQAAAPQELFEEILETQELLAEHRTADPDERQVLHRQLAARRDALQGEQDGRARELVDDLFERWDGANQTDAPPIERAALLGRIRRIIGERAYLQRLLHNLEEAL